MKLIQIQQLAEETMKQHGLIQDGWTFQYDNAVRRFGYCDYRKKLISLSKNLVLLNNLYEINNTILHEIAHALAGNRAGHGREWKQMAKSIGCSGQRCYDSSVVSKPKHKWIGICPNCQREVKRFKRMTIACSNCCDKYNFGRYDEKYKFEWKEN